MMGDTWELFPNRTFPGGVWERVNSTTSPAPRSDAMMVDDVQDGYLLLLGGCADAPAPYGQCRLTRSDSWSFDGTTWTEISTRGVSPAGRAGAGMVYSPSLKAVLLIEGWNGTPGSMGPPGAILGDEASYSGGHWLSLGTSSIVPPRWDVSSSWDSDDNGTVLFGGFGCSASNLSNPCNDTWLASGSSFALYGHPGTGPVSPRGDSAMAFLPMLDPDGEVLLFAGGALGTSGESDTFQFLVPTGWFAVSPWV